MYRSEINVQKQGVWFDRLNTKVGLELLFVDLSSLEGQLYAFSLCASARTHRGYDAKHTKKVH